MIKIAIFASGSGSNAENIINYFAGNKYITVDAVLSNRETAYVHQRAKLLNIDSFSFTKEEFVKSDKVIDLLQKRGANFIVLAGFLLKIPSVIINFYPNRIINVHPALLPKYGGKGMYGDNVHRAVVEAKEKETGITVHYVNENYDEGSIIFQAKCEILDTDTPDDVAQKVHALEYKYFPQIIARVIEAV